MNCKPYSELTVDQRFRFERGGDVCTRLEGKKFKDGKGKAWLLSCDVAVLVEWDFEEYLKTLGRKTCS